MDHLGNSIIFNNLVKKVSFCAFLSEPPKSILEGMMLRYHPIPYDQDIFMYCDIDVLIVKPLHSLTDTMVPRRIYAHHEGLLSHENYGGALKPEERAIFPPNTPGFSSGKFCIYGKDLYRELMNIICSLHQEKSTAYYTIDQPYYNKGLYILATKNTASLDIGIGKSISINGHNFNEHTVLYDAMGKPGDGDFHLDKLVLVSLMFKHKMLSP